MRTDPEIEVLLGPPARPADRPPADSSAPDATPADRPAKRKRGRPVVDHRQRKVLADAKLTELKTAKLLGELLPAIEVRRTWEGILRDVQAALLAVPSRLLAARPSLTPADVAAIDDAIREALSGLAQGRSATMPPPHVEKRAGADPGATAPAPKRARGRRK